MPRRGGDSGSSGGPIEATGTYLPDEQIVVVNRSQHGVAGDIVVTPLQLDDGRTLLVSRGFVPPAAPARPRGRGRDRRPLAPSSSADAGSSATELTASSPKPNESTSTGWPRRLTGRIVPMSIELTSSTRRSRAVPQPVVRPELHEGPHLSYAVQWFIFSAPSSSAGCSPCASRSTPAPAERAARQPAPHRPRQPSQHAVIVRMTAAGGASTRR